MNEIFRNSAGGDKTSTFFISNMDCADEERLIRTTLGGFAGVKALSFDLSQRRLHVTHTLENDDPVLATLKSIGMRAVRVGQQAVRSKP